MKHIAITGAGPAGACLALLLARNGVHTTLIERQTDFSREFRGEFLVPSGISAFDQMGLLQEFRALPSVLPEQLEFYTWGHKRLTLQVSQETFGRHHPTWVSQPDLLEMLVARCTEFPNFQLLRGTTVRDLLREDARCGRRMWREGLSEKCRNRLFAKREATLASSRLSGSAPAWSAISSWDIPATSSESSSSSSSLPSSLTSPS